MDIFITLFFDRFIYYSEILKEKCKECDNKKQSIYLWIDDYSNRHLNYNDNTGIYDAILEDMQYKYGNISSLIDYAAFYITFMELIGKQKLDVIDFDIEIAKLNK